MKCLIVFIIHLRLFPILLNGGENAVIFEEPILPVLVLYFCESSCCDVYSFLFVFIFVLFCFVSFFLLVCLFSCFVLICFVLFCFPSFSLLCFFHHFHMRIYKANCALNRIRLNFVNDLPKLYSCFL